MAVVIPLRPFENALSQSARYPHPAIRRTCIRAVLHELREGRDGNAIAGQLQQTRLRSAPAPRPDGAA